MTQRPPLFDAILFDLDGTLVATDRFWIQAARAGARRAFEELGLERELPDREAWLSMVGIGIEDGFRALFGDLEESQWRLVMTTCMDEEEKLLSAGGAALMPGARNLLTALSLKGARLGIASNCHQSYLDHMVGDLALEPMFDAALCLESPGIRDKAHMIESLLERFGTRSAVMVGDRAADRDAAWSNGIPHVHCAFGFAGHDEPVEAEGRVEDMGELLGLLDRRGAWIESVLAALGLVGRRPGADPLVLGVTGGLAAGKSLFARDAARVLRARGESAVAVSLEGFRTASDGAWSAPDELDLDRLERELIEPLRNGTALRLRRAACLDGGEGQRVAADALVILDGPFLLDPRFLSRLDRTIYLELPDEIRARRLAGREGRAFGLEALSELRSGALPALEAHRERYDPERLADLVLDASNPLGATQTSERALA